MTLAIRYRYRVATTRR